MVFKEFIDVILKFLFHGAVVFKVMVNLIHKIAFTFYYFTKSGFLFIKIIGFNIKVIIVTILIIYDRFF